VLLKVLKCCNKRKLRTSEIKEGFCNKAVIPHLLWIRRAMFARDLNTYGPLHFVSGCSGQNSGLLDFLMAFFNLVAMLQILTPLYIFNL